MNSSKNKSDPHIVMMEHSKAKVELYSTYLSIFLNILTRARFIEKIYLFDLMCGEGKYVDDSKGSPIVALEKIRDHYYANDNKIPSIEILFNDNGKSEIETDKLKIARVRDESAKIFKPPNVNITFESLDYSEIFPSVLEKVDGLKSSERALLFLDPYGYKDVKPIHLQSLLKGKKAEIILFIPISHLYRFAQTSIEDNFQGGAPLRTFLNDLFNNNLPSFKTPFEFMNRLKEQFRSYIGIKDCLVSAFGIERNSHNIYALFFFTTSERGFEKMLEAKWMIDQEHGEGFRFDTTGFLFSKSDLEGYPDRLRKFINEGVKRTNNEIYRFGLENDFLPKHTYTIFKEWQMEDVSFEVKDQDSKPIRKGAFYIGNQTKLIYFSLKSK
jgi:three-Cys-motif partner protein